MDPINDARFYESLIKPPHLRSPQDVRNIYDQLRQLDMFNTLYNAPLKAICASARFERHPPQHVLFREGQVATCWFILLSGSVFIDNHIYLPYGCFGKRNGLNYRRTANCIVLQESEMIVIDYPDVQRISVGPTVSATTKGVISPSSHHSQLDRGPHGALKRYTASSHPSLDGGMPPPVPPRPDRFNNSSSSSISSSTAPPVPNRTHPRGLPRSYPVDFPVDVPSTSFTTVASIAGENHRSQVFVNGVSTSSPAPSSSSSSIPHSQSTSDKMDRMERDEADEATLVRQVKHRREKSNSIGGSSHSTAASRAMRVRSTASSSTTEDAPSSSHGLADSEDEDEESCPSHDSFMELKDSVRECLEKEPGMRNSDDLAVLLDFMQHMAAFASLPVSIKRQLCLKMVFAVVNEAGTIVMHNGERLDAWSVIVNGQVEVVRPSGERVEFKLGDAFGCDPTPTQQYHQGDMRTLVDDCEFVLVEHKDFCSIMSTLSEHIEKDRDGLTGEIVSETERRTVGNQVGLVLIKGKPDKLIAHLVDERDSSIDPHYIDDFLLTYRVFIHNPCTIFEKLMYWFAEPNYRDKVARIVLLWVNNHHNDFETNDEMNKLLTRFEGALERDGMHSQQSLLNIACSVKARPREITMSRANKDEPLPFVLVGGKELNAGIFVSHVDSDSSGDKLGMRRGDEVLEVNGLTLKYVTLGRANELAKGSLQVRLMLKSNILGFKELVARNSPEVMSSSAAAKQRTKALVGALGQPRGSMPNVKGSPISLPPSKAVTMKNGGMMDKLFTMLKSTRLEGSEETDERCTNELRCTRSNPDLANTTISQYYGPVRSDSPEHVLKIYRADQTFKYLPVYKETTAQNVVQLALQEFGMTSEGSLEWSLCETSVTTEKVIKQRRLPPQMENLAERIALNSRYYLKNNSRSDPLVPDDLAPEILKEAQCQLLNLNAHVVACQLTLQDFATFSSIEPTEYVDNLFQLESRYGWARLSEFERLFNREMWWVGSEVCSEKNVGKRAKLIKKFIKVARYCRDLRNFNSMFAIMSGLDKPAVRRLHASWDRVGSKYVRWLEEVHTLVDPSRNMSRYRQHLATVSHDPPVIPIYPVLKKDLTFMHEGNSTYTEKLINFEKLRLIARAIRAVGKLSSAPYEIAAMAERSGGALNDALLHMNTFEYASGTVATMRKSAKGATQPRKKVYEQALMVRKVKTYLAELKVVDNESELDSLSLEIEPSTTSNGNGEKATGSGGPPQRRPISNRPPSPTPSSLSSQSNASGPQSQPSSGTAGGRGGFIGTKFGVESPQAVQKMLSLVQQSKIKERGPPSSPHTSHQSNTLGRSSGMGQAPPPHDTRVLHPSGLPTRGVVRVSSRNGNRDCFYPPPSPSSLSSHSTSSSSHHPSSHHPLHPPPPLPSSLPPHVVDLNAESSSVTGYYHSDIPSLHSMLPAIPHNGPHSSALYRSLFVSPPSPSPSSSSFSSSSSHRPSLPSHHHSPSIPSSQSVGVLMGHRVIPLLGRRMMKPEKGRPPGSRAMSVDDPDHQVSRV